MRLRVVSTADEPVTAAVYVTVRVEDISVDRDIILTDEDGYVELNDSIASIECVKVTPLGDHWACLVFGLREENTIVVKPIEPQHALWWRNVLGVTEDDRRKGRSIKIGVVDIGFHQQATMSNFVEVVVDPAPTTQRRMFSHGYRVSSIICGKSDVHNCGIAPESEIYFVDASFRDEIDGHDPHFVDAFTLADAITILSTQYGADIINISCGLASSRESVADLKDVIELAYERGTICICAVGNDASQPVAFPAAFEFTVGVGGIGLAGIAPDGTLMDYYRVHSQSVKGAIGRLADGTLVFHHSHTSFGSGLDVVAPSLGVTIPLMNGAMVDNEGTSFAAPMVTGLLARKLGDDLTLPTLTGINRSKYILEQLRNMCYDLGMDRQRQGFGLPILEGIS